ncbi:MAG: CSLREA domain-containing protein [Chloroflexota bacterium]
MATWRRTPRHRYALVLSFVALLALGGAMLVAWPGTAHGAATIVVNTTTDEDVSNGTCSLREAIIAANTNVNHNGCTGTGYGSDDVINFNIGSGTPVINVGATALPDITQWVTINGDTGGATRIELHGPGGTPTGGLDGLHVAPGGFGTTIRKLVINNFQDDGIFIQSDEASVVGSYIGTDTAGVAAVPNAGFGVQVYSGTGDVIGGAHSSATCDSDCNVISGNAKGGVLEDSGSQGTMLLGNFIGTNATGTGAVPNAVEGVQIKGASDSVGGDTSDGTCGHTCNLISGNVANGILIDAGASAPVVRGNFIGTNAEGTSSIPNVAGISINDDGVTIGGPNAGDGNVISGNKTSGIDVNGVVTVQGNFIGTNAAGMGKVGNGSDGVFVHAAGNATIGGLNQGTGNLISGNGGSNIYLSGEATILGNYIGTNTTGDAGLSSANGIYVDTGSGLIGSQLEGAGNLISGNAVGINIEGGGPFDIYQNLIGTQADGTSPLGNTGKAGIEIADSAANVVGGLNSGQANVIAFNQDGLFLNGGTNTKIVGNHIHDNTANGVELQLSPTTGNTISQNSIHDDGGRGIRLGNGANTGIHRPIITAASSASVSGTSCSTCTIEVFSDNDGEGRTYEGSTTASGGNWTFSGTISGPDVTATATDTTGNTSEFSNLVDINATPTPTPPHSPSPTPTPSSTPTTETVLWGDNDCNGLLQDNDVFLDLEAVSGIQPPAAAASGVCQVGTSYAGPTVWGDVDCSGTIDVQDALMILEYISVLQPTPPPGCPALSDSVPLNQ